MYKKIICALFMIPFVTNAQLRKLPSDFDKWISSSGMKHATVSLEVSKLTGPETSPEIIYKYDNERSVQPASVMKLVTTAAALSLLGPDYSIPTEVYYDGTVDNGVLNGNIYIKGYGNAMLASSRSKFPKESFVNSVIVSLKVEGIKSISSDIIGDGTVLKQSPISTEWTWEDMGNHYAPSISGLNYDDNMFEIILNTSRKGQKPTVLRIDPVIEGLSIDNQLLSIDYPFDSAYVYGAPYQNTRTLFGAVPHKLPQFKVKGDVPDPAYFATSRVRDAIVSNGIKVGGKVRAISNSDFDYKDFHLLYKHDSEPLNFIAKQTNVFSVNLFAEMLLRQIALKEGNGSETDGINAVMRFLKSLNIDTEGIRMFDGCGLAPADRVTTHFIVELLNKMQNNTDFINSFAVAGKTGTVHSFLKNTRLDGKARLKTGTTKAVIAYSGYVVGSDGNTYAVSFIVNNHTCVSSIVRKNIEKMLLLLIP